MNFWVSFSRVIWEICGNCVLFVSGQGLDPRDSSISSVIGVIVANLNALFVFPSTKYIFDRNAHASASLHRVTDIEVQRN